MASGLIRNKTFTVPTTGLSFTLYLLDTRANMTAYINKKHGSVIPPNSCFEAFIPPAWDEDADKFADVYFNQQFRSYSLIGHEAVHVTLDFFRKQGIDNAPAMEILDEEKFCCVNEWVFSTMVDFVGGGYYLSYSKENLLDSAKFYGFSL